MARIRPQKFVHVVYRTHRFEEMIEWYKATFDAQVVHRHPVITFLTYDDEHHRFAFINLDVVKPDDTEPKKRSLVGVDHLAYTYSSLEDLLDNYEQLKDQGIVPYWCVHHGVTASMYYKDPDGNQMEFQVESFACTHEANEFMASEIFAENPVGVEYDPEDWLAKKKAGESLAACLVREAHLPASPIRGALGG